MLLLLPAPSHRASEELQCGCIQLSGIPSVSCSVKSDSLQPHGLQPTRLLCPWDFPGKNTEVGRHSLLQGVLPTQGLNPGLLHAVRFLPPEPPGSKRTLWVLFSVKAILPGFTPTTCHAELTDKKDIHVLVVKPPRHNINFFNNQ